jgi:short-subunit dehydrogenase
MARELASRGCRVALCARDRDELERARLSVLARGGGECVALVCDVTDRNQVRRLIADATDHFGAVDILINNAGLITVGPLETQTLEDFERAMALMFWAPLYATLEVLPQMRRRGSGRLATITSIGGKLSVPHLLPYSAAKFAAVGLSEGLRAELAREGIRVTTVVPGLMRTGSHVNAMFKGQHQREFLWFSLSALSPVTAMSAEDAARQIVDAVIRGDPEIVLGWQANLAARINGLVPGFTADVLGVVNRFLPPPGGIGARAASGHASRGRVTGQLLGLLGERGPVNELNQQR